MCCGAWFLPPPGIPGQCVVIFGKLVHFFTGRDNKTPGDPCIGMCFPESRYAGSVFSPGIARSLDLNRVENAIPLEENIHLGSTVASPVIYVRRRGHDRHELADFRDNRGFKEGPHERMSSYRAGGRDREGSTEQACIGDSPSSLPRRLKFISCSLKAAASLTNFPKS